MTQIASKGRCFVIQPFDGGKFDKRYTDVFAPAIVAAELEPYRVDQDPGVVVPIETIEKQIAEADACFAEITLDNPNVWFEVGYARALRKPLCMVCSSERTTSFPFDVRHRTIITYCSASPSDFVKLRDDITARLKAMRKTELELQTISSLTPTTITQGLSPHEMALLAILLGDFGESNGSTNWSLKRDMAKAGYTAAATSLAVARLKRSGLIETTTVEDINGEYPAWKLSDRGTDWMLENEQLIQLRRADRDPSGDGDSHFVDDIPF